MRRAYRRDQLPAGDGTEAWQACQNPLVWMLPHPLPESPLGLLAQCLQRRPLRQQRRGAKARRLVWEFG